ncbi:hypothetical protein J7T55_012221 [Diaporthe amygdali]|uniref:uncharacterized protein n=1 Tax=Phomopsis amygdali TaxID=1214568 RepID=UPI0022FEC4A9|nr:uncharacterized protein J7T55_012221 [Diaporthe amygdali]KAJ0123752.1 hypothetical protein J7T55_012221 [Diaporthe amygdali]
MKPISFWPLLAAPAASSNEFSANDSTKTPPIVSTTSGRIHGKVDPSLPNVHQYLGIPYALPPIDAKRWAAPKPLDLPDSDVQATNLPPSCLQYFNHSPINTEVVPEFNLQGLNGTGAISEDCLTLSVWTPANTTASSEGVPVLIWVYGGGYGVGSGQDVPYQIPAQWVDRTPDHIVVSFNYRLGIFGFPNAGGLTDQNLALLDTRALVEWCRKNIAAFGGDPKRIVLWGQSAGSLMANHYGFAYRDDPIVTGLIMNSGTALLPYYTVNDTSRSNFTFVADHVGCAGLADEPDKQLSCMRDVNGSVIIDFVANYSTSIGSGGLTGLAFVPVEDNVLVFSNYTKRAMDGLQANIVRFLIPIHTSLTCLSPSKSDCWKPAIVGTNAQDGILYADYDPINGPNTTVGLEWDLLLFSCPATNTIRLRQQTGLVTFRSVYYGNFSNVSPLPWMGAYHGSESPILMGTHPNFRGNSTPEEYATSHAFQDAYVAFASDPENGLAGQGWKQYTTLGSDEVRGFGRNGVAAEDVSIASTESLCV